MAKSHRTVFDKGMTMLSITLLLGVVGLRMFDPPLLEAARLGVFDNYQRLDPRPYEPAPVRIVNIDDASLAKLGQWPWPRTLLARLVERLNGLGAAAIAFDMVFAEPDRTSPGRYLAQLPAHELGTELRELISALPDHDQLFADAIAQAPVVLGFPGAAEPGSREPRLLAGIAHAGSDPRPFVDTVAGAIPNLPLLEGKAAGQGSFALGSGEGAMVRRVPLLQNIDGRLYPSLGIEALRVAQGASTIVVRATDASGELQVGDSVDLQAVRVGALEIPVTGDGHIWMHYTRPVDGRSLSAADLLERPDAQLAELIQGHIILIGTGAAGLKDLRSTPLVPFEAGVAIHAQAIEQMILGRHLARPAWADGAEILFLIVIGLTLLLLLPRVGAVWCALIGLSTAAAAIAASWFAFSEYRMLLDPVYPSLAAIAVYLGVSFYGYVRAERDKRHVRDAFSTYLAPALVSQLVESPDALRLGGESREMTFLFTDIADFTSFTERSRPERLVELLNDYLDRMCGVVMNHGGTIDKIVGDAIHAIFNAPLDQPDHAARAVGCALELDRVGRELVAASSTPGLQFGMTRIGVNTGTAVIGNFGGHLRFDYTAHGDAINTAARLESVNKHLGTRICISATTAEQCPQWTFRPIGVLLLKGKTRGVETFVPVSAEHKDDELIRGYTRCYEQLRRHDDGARDTLRDLQRRFPDDPLVKLHGKRLERGESGVEIVMGEK